MRSFRPHSSRAVGIDDWTLILFLLAVWQVLARVGGDWVAPGDLVVVAVTDAAGVPWLLASFHGDSGGLSTQPVCYTAMTASVGGEGA